MSPTVAGSAVSFLLLMSAMIAPASAEDPAPADTLSLAERVRRLEEGARRASPADGTIWTSEDGASSLRLRGYVHVDGRVFLADEERPAPTTFLVRRVRPILEATVARRFGVRLMPDWGNGASSLQDGWVELRASDGLRIRAGKFKPPVGYERLVSASVLPFAETSLSSNLVPNRDIGVQLWGNAAGSRLEWALGAFNGTADGGSSDADADDSKEGAARIFVFPFRASGVPALAALGVGAAGTVGNAHGSPASPGLGTMRSFGQQAVFAYRSNGKADSTAVADGRHVRWSPQVSWYAGPLGGFAEYVRSTQEIALGNHSLRAALRAWSASASVVLTGEAMTARGINPKRPLDSGPGAFGAVSVDARLAGLTMDRDVFPVFASPSGAVRAARSVGIGLTWTAHRNAKVLADWERTTFDGGAASGRDREAEQVLVVRTQLAF